MKETLVRSLIFPSRDPEKREEEEEKKGIVSKKNREEPLPDLTDSKLSKVFVRAS